jgi:hypothetical protein
MPVYVFCPRKCPTKASNFSREVSIRAPLFLSRRSSRTTCFNSFISRLLSHRSSKCLGVQNCSGLTGEKSILSPPSSTAQATKACRIGCSLCTALEALATVSDHQNNPFGIQWQRYWDGAPYPDLVKTVPQVAFEVDDLDVAIRDQKVIIDPNIPSKGVLVAEASGAQGRCIDLIRWSTSSRNLYPVQVCWYHP